MSRNVGLLEITGFGPAIVVADCALKAADVQLIGAELNGYYEVVIKLAGDTAELEAAVEAGKRLAEKMHAHHSSSVYPKLSPGARPLVYCEPAHNYNALLQGPEHWFPRERAQDTRSPSMPKETQFALGLIETQGLTAMMEAADAAMKAANVELVGKEKIGGGFVTVMVKGDVAAVTAAVEAGTAACKPHGKHIASHVIPRPHEALIRLLP